MNDIIERVALAISGGDDPSNILTIHRTRARLAIDAMPPKGLLSSDNPHDCRDEKEKWLAWDTAWHKLALEVASHAAAVSHS